MNMESEPLNINAVPLSAAAFAPFGDVIEHNGQGRRHHITQAFTSLPEAVRPSLWISRMTAAIQLPIVIDRMECHPYANQTFVPIGAVRHLVVVCRSDPGGRPDGTSLKAFVAGPGQGITYRSGVWHYGLSLLDAPGDFIVAMSLTDRADDDVFMPLANAVRVHPPHTEFSQR